MPPIWVHCNKCLAFAPNAHERLFILECTHIICIQCLGRLTSAVACPVCATQCAAKSIGSQLPADVQPFFDQALVLSELDRLRYCVQFQTSNQEEAVKSLRDKVERQSELLREARAYIERLQRAQPRQQQQQQRQRPQQAELVSPQRAPSCMGDQYGAGRSGRSRHLAQPPPVYTRTSSAIHRQSLFPPQAQRSSTPRLSTSRRSLYSPLFLPPDPVHFQ